MFRFSIAVVVIALLAWTTPARPRERLSKEDVEQIEAIVAKHAKAEKETVSETNSPAPLTAEVRTSSSKGPYGGSYYTLKRKDGRWVITNVGCRRPTRDP